MATAATEARAAIVVIAAPGATGVARGVMAAVIAALVVKAAVIADLAAKAAETAAPGASVKTAERTKAPRPSSLQRS